MFPAGVKDYSDFDEYLKEITKTGTDDDPVYPITLELDSTDFHVRITLAENYQLDLRHSNFNGLIGFDKKILKDRVNIGDRIPNLSQETDILNIHCVLVNTSFVDGEESDIIYSFSTSVLRPSYSASFEREERIVAYNPINKQHINSIRIYITDGKRRIVNLRGADTAFVLILKRLQ